MNALTANEAEFATGLTARAMQEGGERWEFLRCQLGRPGRVTRRCVDGRDAEVQIFSLVGFGRNWSDAVKRARKNL